MIVQIAFEAVEPPSGRISTASSDQPFEGWLSLLGLLERVLESDGDGGE